MLLKISRLGRKSFCSAKKFNRAYESTFDEKIHNDFPIKNLLKNEQFANTYKNYFDKIIDFDQYTQNVQQEHQKLYGNNHTNFMNEKCQVEINFFSNYENDFGQSNNLVRKTDCSLNKLQELVDQKENRQFVIKLSSGQQKLERNQLRIIDIPVGLNQQEIYQILIKKSLQPQQIQVQKCLAGLPSSALVTFESETQASQFLKQQNGRIVSYDNLNEHQYNRTLVITNLPQNWDEKKIISILSQYGRVVEFEWAKSAQPNDKNLKVISQFNKNISQQTQIALQLSIKKTESIWDIHQQKNENNKSQQVELVQNVDVQKLEYFNKGYCFVTFQSTDQAKSALLRLNQKLVEGSEIRTYLKQNTDHFHYDKQFILQKLDSVLNKQVNNQSNDLRQEVTSMIEENILTNKDDMEFRHGSQVQLDMDKFGRQKPTKLGINDFNEFDQQINQASKLQQQENAKQNILNILNLQNLNKNLTPLQLFEQELETLIAGKYNPELIKQLIDNEESSNVQSPSFIKNLLNNDEHVPLDSLGLRQEFNLSGVSHFKNISNQLYVDHDELLRLEQQFLNDQNEEYQQKYYQTQKNIQQTLNSMPKDFKERLSYLKEQYQDYIKVWAQDVGVINNTFQPKDQSKCEQLVKQLNQEAQIGVQYAIQKNQNDENEIIELLKLPSRFNLEKIEKIVDGEFYQKTINQIADTNKISIDQAKAEFERQIEQMDGSKELQRQALKDIDEEFFQSVMHTTGLTRCEIENILSFDGTIDEGLQEDMAMQLEVMQARKNIRQIKQNDLVKDTQNAWKIIDEHKKYVVSQYKTM